MKTLLFLILLGGTALAQTTQRVSIRTRAALGSLAFQDRPTISADGRYVAFDYDGASLVPADTNGARDVFVHDFQSGTTEIVSISTGGVQGNADSWDSEISADGRFVAFVSSATNLVPGDTNGTADIFVHDRITGTTERVSISTGGAEANASSSFPSISSDGRYVAFSGPATNLVAGDTNGFFDVFVRDRIGNTTERVSVSTGGAEANGDSVIPSISADGRHVAFTSFASNLVTGDTNGVGDAFVRDLQSGTTVRVSVATGGAEGDGTSSLPTISSDGRFVAFDSLATNLVAGDTNGVRDSFLRDIQNGTTERVSVTSNGAQGLAGSDSQTWVSSDGRYVAFDSAAALVPEDTNGFVDVYVRDRQTGTTELVSVSTTHAIGSDYSDFPALSADGRYVSFASRAWSFITDGYYPANNVFVHDRQLGTTHCGNLLNSQGSSFSDQPSISADGSCVAFRSNAPNLINVDSNGFYDVFVYDRSSALTERVSHATSGAEADGPSYSPALSSDGRFVAFESEATNLVSGDGNNARDIFLYDRVTTITERVSVALGGGDANSNNYNASISADGRYVAFRSDASNLVTGDTNFRQDIFVRDRQLGTTERVNVATGGTQGDGYSDYPAISADGRYVAFMSEATNLVAGDTNATFDIFVHDRQSGTTERVSVSTSGAQADADSYGRPAISADGRFVAFASDATNLVAGDTNGTTDVFVRDRLNGTTERLSNATGGVPSISGDGRYVAFESDSTNLVPGDTNGRTDAFVHDRMTGITERVSLAGDGTQGNNYSDTTSISSNGRFVALRSDASNLVTNDTNGWGDVFVRDRGAAIVFTSYCFGDGSGTACPCGNAGASGNGCASSVVASGANLAGFGSAVLSSDTLTLLATGMPSSTCLYFQGNSRANAGLGGVFGDGLRCATGGVKRLGAKANLAGASEYPSGGDSSISVSGAVIVAGTKDYQCWYRNAATFCTASTFNLTNGLEVTWAP